MKILIFIMIIIFGSPAYGLEPERISAPENRSEKTFYYTAKKLSLPILKAIISIGNGYSDQGKSVHKVEAYVTSLSLPGFMFRMNNHFTSFVERDPFSPLRYVKKVDQEGLFVEKKNYFQTVNFDSAHHKAVIEKRETKEIREISLPSHTYDPLAIFARYLLKENLSPGQEIRMSIFDGVKFRPMIFHSKKERINSTLLGDVDTVCIESATTFMSFGEKEGNIRIWYTANGNKIPLSLELDLPVGIVRFDLEKFKEG